MPAWKWIVVGLLILFGLSLIGLIISFSGDVFGILIYDQGLTDRISSEMLDQGEGYNQPKGCSDPTRQSFYDHPVDAVVCSPVGNKYSFSQTGL
jgi:hypothetical protein